MLQAERLGADGRLPDFAWQPLFISAERRLPADPAFASMRTSRPEFVFAPGNRTAGVDVKRA